MNWINETFGVTLPQWAQIAIVFCAVLIALLILIWLFRLIFGRGTARLQRGRKARIGMIEIAPVDEERKLILLRRDHVEHLVLVGGGSDLVVEQGILPAVYNENAGAVTQAAAGGQRFEPGSPAPSTSTAPVAAGAALGGVTSGTAASASDTATAQVASASTDIANNVTDKVADFGTSVSASTTEFAGELKESASDQFDRLTKGTSGITESPEPVVETATAPSTKPAEDSIFSSEPTAQPDRIDDGTLDEPADGKKGDDDMQRLIDELTGGKK